MYETTLPFLGRLKQVDWENYYPREKNAEVNNCGVDSKLAEQETFSWWDLYKIIKTKAWCNGVVKYVADNVGDVLLQLGATSVKNRLGLK